MSTTKVDIFTVDIVPQMQIHEEVSYETEVSIGRHEMSVLHP